MPITYGTSIQNDVAYSLFGRAYSSLSTDEKAAIDGGSTSPTSGHAANQIRLIGLWANYYGLVDRDTLPDAWRAWLVASIAHAASAQMRPDAYQSLERVMVSAREQALSANSVGDVDTVGSTGFALTVSAVRRYVVSVCVKSSPPLLPELEVSDSAIQSAIRTVWEAGATSFRRRNVSLSVSTSGAVTITPNVVIDSVADGVLFSSTGQHIRLVSPSRLAQMRAVPPAATSAFCIEREGSTITWQFDKNPASALTLYGVGLLAVPTTADETETNAALAKIPPEVGEAIRQLAVAAVRYNHGRISRGEYEAARTESLALVRERDSVGTDNHDGPMRSAAALSPFAAFDSPWWSGGGL